jgi:hypothetical protein
MSFLVFCTFDLKGASSTDYQNAYSDLAKIGLTKVHKTSTGGNAVIPTTAAMGFFAGNSANSICGEVRDKVKAAFKARGFKSEIFVTVGGQDWSWVPDST